MAGKNLEAISKVPNGPISMSGLNRNPRNIDIYSSGYDPAPSLTSNNFSVFEIASNKIGVKPTHLTELKKEGDILKSVSDSIGRDNCQRKSYFDNRIYKEPLKNRFKFTLY